MCAALAAAHWNHDLEEEEIEIAESEWEEYWAGTRPVELTREVERDAGRLAREYGLRGADAVHLASARVLGDPELVVAAWDKKLCSSARAAGFRVAPVVVE